jgi:hypothetical protein
LAQDCIAITNHSCCRVFQLVEGLGGGLPNGAGPCYHADCDGFNLVDEKGMKNIVRYGAMLLYGVADATEIKSKHLTDQETKQFLIDRNLKEALQIAGDWRWKD